MVALKKTPPPQTEHGQLELPVDVEHGGIRAAGCGTFAVGSILGFFLLNLLGIPAVATAIGSLVVGGLIANLMDRYLKENWSSGRVLLADAEQIILRQRDDVERELNPLQHVNVLAWRFEVPRTGRVRRGWYVLALALEQDGDYLAAYTFASPKTFEGMPHSDLFTRLDRKKRRKSKSESIREMKAAGEQRRLLEAESERGFNGAELTYEDFLQYLTFLHESYPKWMSRS